MPALCLPRFATPRRPDRPTRGPEYERVAGLLGLELLPWQRLTLDLFGEYDPDTGIPYYDDLVWSVPRQSGKTTGVGLVYLVHRCLFWPTQPQHVVYTAQTGSDARAKWLKELIPLLERSDVAPFIRNIKRANGTEAVEFATGSIISIISTSEGSGHGLTVNAAMLDELFADTDERRAQSIRPTTSTVRDRQILSCSTAGTQRSMAWNRKLKAGRRAAEADVGTGTAFLEWSAPDGFDPTDRTLWPTYMPALGHTITADVIAGELAAMTIDDFSRSYGNRTSRTNDELIPLDSWRDVTARNVAPAGPLAFAIDVSPDRRTAAIAAADADGNAELIEYRSGVGWLPDRLDELRDRWSARTVRHKQSPAGAIDLTDIDDLGTEDVIRACGSLFDAVVDDKVAIRPDPALDQAVAGAIKRDVGDAWLFSRKSSAEDVTPLIAVTLALYAARRPSDGGPSIYETRRGIVTI